MGVEPETSSMLIHTYTTNTWIYILTHDGSQFPLFYLKKEFLFKLEFSLPFVITQNAIK